MARRADHEHDHQALAERRERVDAVFAMRHDPGNKRVGTRLGERLQQQRHVEARHAPDTEFRIFIHKVTTARNECVLYHIFTRPQFPIAPKGKKG